MREIGESFVSGPLGLGTQRIDRLDVDGSVELLQTAHELGIQVLDTADIYGEEQGAAERRLGEALGASGLRDRFVVAGKAGVEFGVPYCSSAAHLREAVHGSLERLGIDRFDLFQIHRPDCFTHPGEVADALVLLHEEALIGEVGVSNFSSSQLAAPRPTCRSNCGRSRSSTPRFHTELLFGRDLLIRSWSSDSPADLESARRRSARLRRHRPDLAELPSIACQRRRSPGPRRGGLVLAHPASPIALAGHDVAAAPS
ncbi:MAG: aldo/keto reductase [Ilumatobacteraceae bacterium]